jgi:hypothetical protein
LDPTQLIRFNQNRELFEVGLNQVYKDTLPLHPQQYKTWLREETATEFYKTDYAASGLGVMPEKQPGQRFAMDRPKFSPTKQHVMRTYGLSLVIQYEVMRWDLYKVFKPVTMQLAKSAQTRYDLVAFGLLNNGFSTANSAYLDYRGDAICATSHSRLDGGTWKNRPTQDMGLSMNALQTATTDMKKTPNDRGLYTTLIPRLLITAVENEWIAKVLLKSATNPENANQAHSPVTDYNLKHLPSVYITTPTAWFLCADKEIYKICMALGDSPDLMMDSEPGTRNRIYTSYCSFRLEVFDGKGIYGSTGN